MPNFNSTKNQINLRANTYHRKDIPAVALLAALIGISQVSYANSLPLGNTAGSNNIAVGTDSFASGSGSQAVGNNAIATGGNITPEEFKAELENFRELLNNIEGLRTQIAEQEKQGTVNQQLQDALNSQIAQYESILERVRDKLAQQAELTNQKTTKQGELDSETNRLKEMENGFGSNAFIPGGTKESYRNFLNIINALDWNKLNTPTGIADLTTDLKNGVEKDFGRLNITNQEYQDLIEGYRNAQGTITFNTPIFMEKYKQHFSMQDTGNMGYFYSLNGSYYSYADTSSITQGTLVRNFTYTDKDMDATQFLQKILAPNYTSSYLALDYKVIMPNRLDFDSSAAYQKAYKEWQERQEQHRQQTKYYDAYFTQTANSDIQLNTLKKLLVDNTSSKTYQLFQMYNKNPYLYGQVYGGMSNRPEHLLLLPALSKSLEERNEFSSAYVLENLVRVIASPESLSRTVQLNTVESLEFELSAFDKYISLIDYNSDNWLFDKNEYKAYVDSNVMPFMEKIREVTTKIRSLENNALTEEERNKISADVIALRKNLSTIYQNKTNYLSGFRPTKWIPEVTEAIKASQNLWLEHQKEARATLLPYNNDSVVLKEITKAIDAKAAEISTQQETIKTKQTEIADLENQINALALTGEEQSAESIKNDLTVKLDEAKAKLAEITQVLTEKRNELLGLNNQLDTSPLGSKGKNAIAEGNNAFASGENAIATGANSLATGNNAIALGANAKATAESAIAIGKGAQALKAKALALGENAIANGVSAIAIGDNTGVSGEKAVGIGSNSIVSGDGAVSIGSDNIVAHKNAVAIGSKITQTAENSVNLGNESAATVERTAETAGTTKYEHSDLLGEVYKFAASQAVGVVTVGAKGKERRVQNVAAGLVSETSTDAVNGSQLYAVAKAVDEGKLGVVKYNSTSGVVGVANHLGGNEVNISNASGETRRLAGVSEGVAPTDAVNKAQLDREIGAVHNRIGGVESRIGGVENRVNHVEKEVKKVKGAISNAVAMASLPQASAPGQRQLSVATGHTLGTTSVAVGLNGLSDNGRISYKLNTSVSQKSDFAVGAGVGFTW